MAQSDRRNEEYDLDETKGKETCDINYDINKKLEDVADFCEISRIKKDERTKFLNDSILEVEMMRENIKKVSELRAKHWEAVLTPLHNPLPGLKDSMKSKTGTRASHSSSRRIYETDGDKSQQKIANIDRLVPLSQAKLDAMCVRKGRKSIDVTTECTKICSIIKAANEDIIHVYPAYKLKDKCKIVFIAFAEQHQTMQSRWDVEVKILNQRNEESLHKMQMNNINDCPLPSQKAKQISVIIDNCASDLMKKHTYLSAITAGSEKDDDTSATAFINVYVLAKHFIPLNEKPFQTEIEGIPVRIREGDFQLCGRSADQFQDNLIMGCRITSSHKPDQFGTLGGFIEHPEYGLCGLTCAHVFMTDNEIIDLKERGKADTKTILPGFSIYQPSFVEANKVGQLVEVMYKEGAGSSKPGVDLALFKVEKRSPVAGAFPDHRGTPIDSNYRSGYVWGKKGITSNHSPEVQKFGFVTGQTYGNIKFDNAVVKEVRFHSKKNSEGLEVTTTLFKQYHITSNTSEPFCKAGDSGALVFMRDNEQNDLRCIGMVVGEINGTECFVTPITAILEELKVQQLKPFNQFLTLDLLETRLQAMENRLRADINARSQRSINISCLLRKKTQISE